MRTELLVRQAIFSRTSRHGHVCSPRSARAGLDPPRNIAAARKPGNVCSSAMEFAIAIAHGVADKHRPPHPPHIGARQDEYLALPQLRDNAMDLWGFKKWRRKLGYTQSVAGEKLGLSRGAVQYWESEIRPVPVAVELACQELLRLWKRRPEFGPVTLLYVDEPISLETSASVGSLLMRSERHPNIESALRRVAQARDTANLLIAFIVEDDGNVVWSGPELLREIDARKDATVGEKPSIAKSSTISPAKRQTL